MGKISVNRNKKQTSIYLTKENVEFLRVASFEQRLSKTAIIDEALRDVADKYEIAKMEAAD